MISDGILEIECNLPMISLFWGVCWVGALKSGEYFEWSRVLTSVCSCLIICVVFVRKRGREGEGAVVVVGWVNQWG